MKQQQAKEQVFLQRLKRVLREKRMRLGGTTITKQMKKKNTLVGGAQGAEGLVGKAIRMTKIDLNGGEL